MKAIFFPIYIHFKIIFVSVAREKNRTSIDKTHS